MRNALGTTARFTGTFLAAGCIALACGGSSSDPPPVGSGTVIGPGGGTVTAGGVTVVVPAGAVSRDVTIGVTDDELAAAGYVVQGKVYRFSPSGLRFAIPITVTMPGSAPAVVFWTDEGTEDRFTARATRYGSAGATASITHFSSGFAGSQSLIVDASPDADGDADGKLDAGPDAGPLTCAGACVAGKKRCGAACVTLTDPTYGCSANSCATCAPEAVARTAAAKCTGDQCAVGRCFAGFADCNAMWDDGCESDLATPETCGACGKNCAAGEVCDSGTCAAACTFPRTNCGGRCRDISSDPAACGACAAAVCPAVHGTASCVNGACGLACDSGFATCGSTSGCLSNLQSGPSGTSCGACNTPCAAAVGESAICTAGACVKACLAGYTACGGTCVDAKVDAANCGACGVACGAGNLCLGGACKPQSASRILDGLGSPVDIAVDAKNLYYADSTTNEVWQVDKSTFATTLLASGQASPLRLAVDDTYVYWSSNLGGAVLRAPIGGGTPATVLYPANKPSGVAVDASYIYWADSGTSRIVRAPKTPGGVAVAFTFAAGGPGNPVTADELRIDGARLYGSSTGCQASNLLGVFSLDRTMTSGGTITPMGGCFPGLHYGIGVADGKSYSFFGYTGQPFTITQLPSGSTLTVPSIPLGRGAIVADACAQYWTDGKSGIWEHTGVTPFLGETNVRLLTAAGTTTGRLAVDSAYVYWTDAGFIGRVPK